MEALKGVARQCQDKKESTDVCLECLSQSQSEIKELEAKLTEMKESVLQTKQLIAEEESRIKRRYGIHSL